MRTIITSFFLLLTILAKAQITGVVTDASTGVVIAGCMVTTKENSTFTDENGKYSIGAKVGEEIKFVYLGYKTSIVKVAKAQVVNVLLKAEVLYLEEVVITDMAAKQERKQLVYSTQQMTASAVQSSVPMYYTARVITDREEYTGFKDNGFKNPIKDPLSTFAADVDVASYNIIKRYIQSGRMPPVDAVRIEEMINYFQYEHNQPSGDKPVSMTTELTYAPWSKENQLMRITLKGKDIPKDVLPASNFVFLIDISGSMYVENKLPLVKSSMKLLIDQLRDKDKVAIVTYAGAANVALESISAKNKQKIKDVIEGLSAGGSTAGGDGLKMAYNIARQNFIANGNNRIVMATDGDFNVGSSRDDDMENLVAKEHDSNVNISVLGYGMGNYKDAKLETIANKGRGNYAYINTIGEARKAMISEFGGTMFTIAKDVKIQVEFNPKYVQSYRLIGYENRLLEAEDFNNDSKIGGDMGVGHVVTALYEIVPVGVKSSMVGTVDPLKYQQPKTIDVLNSSTEVATVKFRYKEPQGEKSKLQQQIIYNNPEEFRKTSLDLQFMTSVVEFGMLLRDSQYKQDANFESLISRARLSKDVDFEGYRTEFVKLAEDACALYKANRVVQHKK